MLTNKKLQVSHEKDEETDDGPDLLNTLNIKTKTKTSSKKSKIALNHRKSPERFKLTNQNSFQ